MGRVVTECHGPRLRGSGEHVKKVEVVAGRRHRRAVVAVGDEDDVAGLDLGVDVDLAIGTRGVDPLVAPGARRALGGAAANLEVVDLLELGLARAGFVVLVRRVRGPIAAGHDHLDGDETVGVEAVGRGEVVALATAPTRRRATPRARPRRAP